MKQETVRTRRLVLRALRASDYPQWFDACVNLDNKKSIRLVKAIGMRREGIKKSIGLSSANGSIT